MRKKEGKYILRGHRAVPCHDVLKWAQWYENIEHRTVARTEFEKDGKTVLVSTVFLGLDHNYTDGSPILFETMVFYPPSYRDQEMRRYSTWEEAETGHWAAVERWGGRRP